MRAFAAGLAALGRFGTQALMLSVLAGLAAPALASLARPFLPVTVVAFLTLMFARLDVADLRRLRARPGPGLLAAVWLLGAPPILFGTALGVMGRDALEPGLVLGVALQAAAPPLSSTPGIAVLLGIGPTLVLFAVLATTAASAVTAPLMADFVSGTAVPLDVPSFVLRLSSLIGGSIALAILIRAAFGPARLRRHGPSLDGLAVGFYVVFGVAAMDGVLAATLRDPLRSVAFLGMSSLLSLLGFFASWAFLRVLASGDRLVVGYATGQRNMSVLIGALGATVPDATFLYFALSQLPIFILPHLIRPLARRALRRT